MNTREKLRPRTMTPLAAPLAARAMVLCEQCPMARLCQIRDSDACAEVGGAAEYTRQSYRSELMDNSKPIVMARPRIEPLQTIEPSEIKLPSRSMAPKPPLQPIQFTPTQRVSFPPAPVRETTPPKERVQPRAAKERTMASAIIADVLASLLPG